MFQVVTRVSPFAAARSEGALESERHPLVIARSDATPGSGPGAGAESPYRHPGRLLRFPRNDSGTGDANRTAGTNRAGERRPA